MLGEWKCRTSWMKMVGGEGWDVGWEVRGRGGESDVEDKEGREK